MSVKELDSHLFWYCGFADVNGIQYFATDWVDTYGFGIGRAQSDVDAEKFSLCIKSFANKTCQSVVFRAGFSHNDNDDSLILKLLENCEVNDSMTRSYVLKLIKAKAKRIQLSTYKTTIDIAKKNWDIITSQ